ncbi:MAG TPA: periplasmic heavy metal sensor [Ferruginibacter sp.]|nr:periplasmic heavy metal sensor [Ferruginibacter sp.]
MKKAIQSTRTLGLIIAILLISNAVTLVYFWSQKSCPPKHGSKEDGRKEMMKALLKKEVGFSEEQLVSFDSLFAEQRKTMEPKMNAFREKKETLLKNLAQLQFNETAMDSTLKLLSEQQQEMERHMIRSMLSVRNLCKPDQLPTFDSNFYKLLSRRPNRNKH